MISRFAGKTGVWLTAFALLLGGIRVQASSSGGAKPGSEKEMAASAAQAVSGSSSAEPAAGENAEAMLNGKSWKDMVLVLDGRLLKLPFPYSSISGDWSFDLADYGYDKGYVLNPGDKVVGTIELKNPKYDRIRCMAGFMNTGEGIRQIEETDIWSLTIDASSADVRPDLMLPGGITWGSTADEILSVCGQPEEEPYVAEDLGYTVYSWFPDFQYKMKLTVYDDGGLKALTLENYAGK